MKKLILTTFVLFSGLGILFAGDGCDNYASVKDLSKTTPEIVLTSNNLQLLNILTTMGLLDLPYKILTELL